MSRPRFVFRVPPGRPGIWRTIVGCAIVALVLVLVVVGITWFLVLLVVLVPAGFVIGWLFRISRRNAGNKKPFSERDPSDQPDPFDDDGTDQHTVRDAVWHDKSNNRS